MNNTDKNIIERMIGVIFDLDNAMSEHPKNARIYYKTRIKVEFALTQLGGTIPKRELKRPVSVGLPKHELKAEPEPPEQAGGYTGDFVADNLGEFED